MHLDRLTGRDAHLRGLLHAARHWQQLDALASQLSLEWMWVKGHAGNLYNELCDTLAVEAAKKAK